ncbi:ABC transporter substrate-binding protein [Nesterenkonia ebinurensis]|uniref:ABC transporter substrate-binding protein n=1 Tax=Nesterenkonia ebinurensis TaxID=2608252 RepID=UPI00168ACE7F|nr:ABC transporter substrate-binding protein [Nesterenkonia ebinurensis]
MRNRSATLGAGLLALSLSACGGVPGTTSDNGSENGGEEESRTLVFAQSADPTTMDPQDARSTSAERVNRNIYSRLFRRDAEMELVEDLVIDYEQVDEQTWRFTITDEAVFHNGDPLTAADVEFSINRVITDDTLLEYVEFNQITSVEAIGDYEIELTTDGPMPTLINVLSKGGADIMPSEYIEENGIEGFIASPIGSGPYEFVEWRQDDRVVLTANEDYWGGEPQWDEVELRAIPENSTRVSELLTGGVDIAADVPPNDWDRIDDEDGSHMVFGDTTRVMLLIVRMTDGYITADPEIREAIDLAIDQGTITETLFEGNATPVRSRVPVGSFGANEELYDDFLYDPERAAELVAAADETPEVTLTASRGNYPFDGEVAEMIASYLEEVGFEVNLDIREGGSYSDMYSERNNEELFLIGLADGMLDASSPMVHYTPETAEGMTDYFSEEVIDLLNQAGRTLDEEERAQLYAEAQEIVAEDRPHIPLYVQPGAFGVSDGVDFTPRLDDNLYFDDILPND